MTRRGVGTGEGRRERGGAASPMRAAFPAGGAGGSVEQPLARSVPQPAGTAARSEEAPARARAAGMAGPAWGPPRLDGFILTERLGSGRYATVYKAYAKVGAGRWPRARPS